MQPLQAWAQEWAADTTVHPPRLMVLDRLVGLEYGTIEIEHAAQAGAARTATAIPVDSNNAESATISRRTFPSARHGPAFTIMVEARGGVQAN